MRQGRVWIVALAALLVAAAAWWLRADVDLALAPNGGGTAPAPLPAELASVAAPLPAVAPAAPRAEPAVAPVTGERDVHAATAGLQLRVRLRGLHRDAPWTAPLHLDVDGRDEAAGAWLDCDLVATAAPDGTAAFALPDWVATATRQKGRLTAHDANYQPLAKHWDGPPEQAAEVVLDVQVVGRLAGRVLDHDGAPVPAVRVVAFALRDGQPVDGELASCNTRVDGTWSLAAPPGAPLWLLAAPMHGQRGRLEPTGFDGAVPDGGQLREDLLPASATATARIGAVTAVPDLVLARAAQLAVSVLWTDGAPIAGATVQVLPRTGATFALRNSTFVQRLDDGRLSPGALATTDDAGAGVLPAAAGAAVDVRLVGLDQCALAGARPLQRATAPQRVEFRLPRPVRLRVLANGAPVERAAIELGDGARPHRTDATGELRVVVPTPLRVRASHQRLRSPWRELGPADAGATVDLELAESRGEVSLEFDGDFPVRNTIVVWRRDDGAEGREHLLRDDRSGPFRLYLEPGRYQLTAGPGGGERNGVFLLPVEREIEVGGAPVVVRLRAVFGGTFTVHATTGSGLWVGGSCRVVDAQGNDVTGRFRIGGGEAREGAPGEILPGEANLFAEILRPGDYELLADFGAHGAQRQRFTIRPRETTEVHVRLP